MTYRVLLIGCGRIAGGFDAERPADALPLTHAGAYARHGGFALAACVEPDTTRRAAFMRRWDIADGAADIAALQARPGTFDVISLCSPTALHAAHLDAALALAPRLVFCEKPVTPTLAETERLVAQCERAGVPLAVNHTRRWAPDVSRHIADLRAGRHGTLRSVVAHYNKGVLNNGSHLLDLLLWLLGPLEIAGVGAPQWDHGPDDPTVPALLRSADGVYVHLCAAHADDYAHFELQVLTSQGSLTMLDGGQRWLQREAVASPHFAGYRALDAGREFAGAYDQAMAAAVANLHAALATGAALASTGTTALQAQRLCAALTAASLVHAPPPDDRTLPTGARR